MLSYLSQLTSYTHNEIFAYLEDLFRHNNQANISNLCICIVCFFQTPKKRMGYFALQIQRFSHFISSAQLTYTGLALCVHFINNLHFLLFIHVAALLLSLLRVFAFDVYVSFYHCQGITKIRSANDKAKCRKITHNFFEYFIAIHLFMR